MAAQVPIRTVFDGSTATGLAEFQSGEFLALTYGGLGASLSIGSAGQVLKVNSGASALEFGAVEAIVNIDNATNLTSATLVAGDQILASDGGTEGRVTLSQLDTLFSGTSKTLTNKTLTAPTITGTAVMADLDISGDVDIDGTLEADAITIDGVTLSETIADTIGTMVTSNTETGITVTYDDNDNTLDFVVGTLNQNTTGNATTATTLETARTIGGVSFDGSANINLPGVNASGNQDTSGTAAIATTVTITDNESTNENNAIIFTAGGDVDGGNIGLESDGTLTYNPSTGKITATGFIGALTGNVTGNLAGTVSTATQNSITTATGLVSVGALNSGSITSGFTSIDVGAGAITTTGLISGGNLAVANGGTIGSASDADAITIASGGNVTFSQDIIVTGDLTVNGTTTTVNSTTVTIDDPIFTLGGDSAPGSDDNKDRGIEFRYHDGSSARVGFFGFDDSAGAFTFLTSATNSSEVFSGTIGNLTAGIGTFASLDIEGNVDINGSLETDGLSLNGVTISATATELNYTDGVTSAIQTQLDSKTTATAAADDATALSIALG
jgi:hypothetical protein